MSKDCMSRPEKFKRFNQVVKFTNRYKENASGICGCGKGLNCMTNILALASVRIVGSGTTYPDKG